MLAVGRESLSANTRDVLALLVDTLLFLRRRWEDVLRVGILPLFIVLIFRASVVFDGDESGWSGFSFLVTVLMVAWFSTAIHRMILVPPTLEQAKFLRPIESKEFRLSLYYALLALPIGIVLLFTDIVRDFTVDPWTAWIAAFGTGFYLYLLVRCSLVLQAAALCLEAGMMEYFRLSWLRMRVFVLRTFVVGTVLLLVLAGIGFVFGLLWNMSMGHVLNIPTDHAAFRLAGNSTFIFVGWGVFVIFLSYLFRYRAEDQIDLYLAGVHRKGKNFGGARQYYERVHRFQEDELGSEHPTAVESLKDLAMNNLAEEEYPEAEIQFQRLLEIQEATLGPEHSGVVETLGPVEIHCELMRAAAA